MYSAIFSILVTTVCASLLLTYVMIIATRRAEKLCTFTIMSYYLSRLVERGSNECEESLLWILQNIYPISSSTWCYHNFFIIEFRGRKFECRESCVLCGCPVWFARDQGHYERITDAGIMVKRWRRQRWVSVEGADLEEIVSQRECPASSAGSGDVQTLKRTFGLSRVLFFFLVVSSCILLYVSGSLSWSFCR